MKSEVIQLAYEIEPAPQPDPIRDHTAFLNSYAPKDEGLYDDVSSQ